MAKSGLFSRIGAGQQPQMGGAPMASPRPAPRPTAGASPTTGGGFMSGMFQRGNGGILPERGSQQQYDMVMALLQAGMQGAAQSGSPLLAFMAPFLGGAIGTRTAGLREGAASQGGDALTDSLLGNNAEARKYADILADPNLPPHLKGIAQTMMTDALKTVPVPGASTPGRSRSRGTSSSGAPATPATPPTSLDDMTDDQLWQLTQNKGVPAATRNLAGRIVYERRYGAGASGAPAVPGAEVPAVPLAQPGAAETPVPNQTPPPLPGTVPY